MRHDLGKYNIICSSILQKTEVREIGRKLFGLVLSPPLGTGFTCAFFQSSGILLVSNDCWKISDNRAADVWAVIFRSFVLMPSDPGLELRGRRSIAFTTPFLEMVIGSLVWGITRDWRGTRVSKGSSSVNTPLKCALNSSEEAARDRAPPLSSGRVGTAWFSFGLTERQNFFYYILTC